MEKIEVSAERLYYPMPCSLVGANVEDKANFLTVAWFTMANPKPPCVLVTLNKAHYTNAGIVENGTFSINIPSVKMVKKTDHCGLVSGKTTDKAALFKTFYGKLKTAPMIEDCPINMECTLTKTVDFPTHDIFIGNVTATYCDEAVLTEGTVDFSKVQPILFVMNDKSYWKLGDKFAKAWDVGKEPK